MLVRRRLSLFALCTLVLSLTGCNAPKLDPQIQAAAKSSFDDVRRGDYSALNTMLDSKIVTADLTSKLEEMRGKIPPGKPVSSRNIAWNTVSMARGEQSADVLDEYVSGGYVVAWDTHLHRSPSTEWLIDGLHINSASQKELSANRFTFVGKTALQYLFLTATALSPVLMIAALIKVIRTKGLRRKWLWGILSFVGLFSFQMNWATRQMAANFLTIQFIGAGATRGASAFAAWVLTMTFPVGALLILAGVVAKPRGISEPVIGGRGKSQEPPPVVESTN